MGWAPVLDGERAEQARRVVRDIADALASGAGEHRRPAELAVFWAYAASSLDDEATTTAYERAVQDLVDALPEHQRSALYGGLAGVGFALAHVAGDGVADEILEYIDRALLGVVAVPAWKGTYGLIEGLVGIGMYFLERRDRSPRARDGLERIIEHLHATSEVTREGTTWHTHPDVLPAWQREREPGGHYNCGLAHGVPGIIAFLARLGSPRARVLACEAMRWCVEQRIEHDPRGRFPATVRSDSADRTPSRTAWCYGDPGVAIALWGARSRLELPLDDALTLARDIALRPFELCGIVEPGLCHGTAGMGHLLNRYYQASGDPVFATAARSWFERTLALQGDGGLAGFAAHSTLDPTRGLVPTASLLEGALGIGLALLAAIEPTEPRWDRLLLCDLPISDQPVVQVGPRYGESDGTV